MKASTCASLEAILSETPALESPLTTFLARLAQEVKDVWPEKDAPASYETLEKLPYLVSFQRFPNLGHLLADMLGGCYLDSRY